VTVTPDAPESVTVKVTLTDARYQPVLQAAALQRMVVVGAPVSILTSVAPTASTFPAVSQAR
jgi:hypothetical protein